MVPPFTTDTPQEINFNPDLSEIVQNTRRPNLYVFSGSNNSGKSLLLKFLKLQLGPTCYYLSPVRFYHVYHLSSVPKDPNRLTNYDQQFHQTYLNQEQNHEQNFIDLNTTITTLSNNKRKLLLELCSELIGNTFTIKKVDPNNDFSQSYVDMDGYNLNVSSTGTRLLMTLLGICFDESFTHIIIDEPELGLSPRVQSAVSDFFQNDTRRNEYFPHLQAIYIATHSHIFLNRKDFTSNFIVSKNGNNVSCQQIKTVNDFHKLQYNLLGNTLESMFFPSAFVIVEGKTDYNYLERVISLKFPDNKITIIGSNGDPKKKVHSLKEVIGDLEKSPYKTRVFVVLDKVVNPGLKAELIKQGILEENIIQWSRNGIEYVYPVQTLCKIFGCQPASVENLDLTGDRITINGITKTKNELADEVTKFYSGQEILPQELEQFLIKLEASFN
ncbi:ATP-dependent nuclease [Pontibacter burrus]|uniref:AAA family ATPase n=1 Tax=Pontibacter burrus TaxID=2704466 RepID=A0A6B3LUG0_9BACT|nr:AAA family ATPase [Pontibacter burrus]NEM97140.1 AAA family ATPase [Pontibacter burrus]